MRWWKIDSPVSESLPLARYPYAINGLIKVLFASHKLFSDTISIKMHYNVSVGDNSCKKLPLPDQRVCNVSLLGIIRHLIRGYVSA